MLEQTAAAAAVAAARVFGVGARRSGSGIKAEARRRRGGSKAVAKGREGKGRVWNGGATWRAVIGRGAWLCTALEIRAWAHRTTLSVGVLRHACPAWPFRCCRVYEF